jgi:hypothetical protein
MFLIQNKSFILIIQRNSCTGKYTFGLLSLFGRSVPFLLVVLFLRPIIPSKRTQKKLFSWNFKSWWPVVAVMHQFVALFVSTEYVFPGLNKPSKAQKPALIFINSRKDE